MPFTLALTPRLTACTLGTFCRWWLCAICKTAGHVPIALVGGGTGMVGDPSGRTDMRKMMTPETIAHNCECFKKQLSSVIDFSDGKAIMVNNADWLLNLNYIEFLREIGAHFSVNRMLTFECFKSRMEKGLSFLEFNYMLMQSYDFLQLYKRYGCKLELGGDDQWSNIIGGIELVRKKEGAQVYGMTFTLLTNSQGQKMGKTASGALWARPREGFALRLLPVLAKRCRRRRVPVFKAGNFCGHGRNCRNGNLGGAATEPGQRTACL